MKTVKINDNNVLARMDKAGSFPIAVKFSTAQSAQRKVAQLSKQGVQAEVYQPRRVVFVKIVN